MTTLPAFGLRRTFRRWLGLKPADGKESAMALILRRTGALAVCAASLGLADCATAAPYNPENLPANQLSQVGTICETVVGVRRGEEHYDACVESLSGSLRNADDGRAMLEARGYCGAKGYAPGSPALAECVLRASETQVVSGSSEPGGGQPIAETPSTSYFATSPRESFRHEQLACARRWT